jgi:hypothetical protein
MQVRTLVGKSLVVLSVLVLSAGVVSAAGFTYNFDDGSNPFTTIAGGPTVTTAQAHSGPNSLYIAPGDNATLSIPGAASGGVVKMWIYDLGKWATNDPNFAGAGSANGWRAGLAGAGDVGSSMIALWSRSYTPSRDGYQCGSVGAGSAFGDWFSPFWASTNRQVVSLSTTPDDGSAGVGEWSQWSFTFFPDGNVVMNLCDSLGNPIPSNSSMTQVVTGGVTDIFLSGGGSELGGLYVDDVTFTPAPEPMTMALLGAGAVLGLVRRNRRK